jgi:2-polyprenyl-3-methyl-5-hydroxy-6-metoxy-1,4-benzoquinol methylase
MAERTEDVQAHWTRPGVLARIDAALTELGHDPQNLNPEILATVEHLHSGGFITTCDQAKRVSITDESRVLDVGCGIGGPARYLAHTYGCRVDGIDLTPELVENRISHSRMDELLRSRDRALRADAKRAAQTVWPAHLWR